MATYSVDMYENPDETHETHETPEIISRTCESVAKNGELAKHIFRLEKLMPKCHMYTKEDGYKCRVQIKRQISILMTEVMDT